MGDLYPAFHTLHYWLSRIGFAGGLLMLALALYIGLIRHGDVTRWFRCGVYAMIGLVGVEFLAGLVMYVLGGRPGDEVHLIYGVGALLSLPFFVFVETTARKRPAMGSYIWGFLLLVGIFVRGIMTGTHG